MIFSDEDDIVAPAPPKNDEPDWVRDFSQSIPNDEESRRRAITSLYEEFDDDDVDNDDDEDSIINLISQEPDKKPTSRPSKSGLSGDNGKQPSNERSTPKRPRYQAPKSALPLVVAPKLDDSLVLLQGAEKSLDLSGDVGAVGRTKVQDGVLFLDIKGVVYRTNLHSCNTVCVVSVNDDAARVTSVLNEAVTLTSERNLFASDEIVIHGNVDEELDSDMGLSDDVNGDPSQDTSLVKEKKQKVGGSLKMGKVKTPKRVKVPRTSKAISKSGRSKK